MAEPIENILIQPEIQTNPELCLMGAGPGDMELLTVKACKRLKMAAVVLYDHLANAEMLTLTSSSCEHIYVGKIAYGNYTPQEEIHRLIAANIHKGLVVRLKGGDPFIFGRGFEEVLFARSLGIKTEYIPGISSMQTFGMEDIPLTHRGVSESIWVLTGTKKDFELSSDLKLAMGSGATVVIYMGLKKLSQIAEVYINAGRGETPAAIIQAATLSKKVCIKACIAELPALASEAGLTFPAIILIGDVVALTRLIANAD